MWLIYILNKLTVYVFFKRGKEERKMVSLMFYFFLRISEKQNSPEHK